MNLIEAIGFTLDTAGKLMVAFTALAVHRRVWKEHKIDERILSFMLKEQRIGIAGVALILLGYLLQLPFKL